MRINQIWVSSILGYSLEQVLIEDMSIDTDSNYSLVLAELMLNYLEYKSRLAQNKRKDEKQTIFEYDKATIENCN